MTENRNVPRELLDRMGGISGLIYSSLPVVVLQDAPAPGLIAIRERPDAGVAKHREYALTWFSLAALALVLWIALNIRRER